MPHSRTSSHVRPRAQNYWSPLATLLDEEDNEDDKSNIKEKTWTTEPIQPTETQQHSKSNISKSTTPLLSSSQTNAYGPEIATPATPATPPYSTYRCLKTTPPSLCGSKTIDFDQFNTTPNSPTTSNDTRKQLPKSTGGHKQNSANCPNAHHNKETTLNKQSSNGTKQPAILPASPTLNPNGQYQPSTHGTKVTSLLKQTSQLNPYGNKQTRITTRNTKLKPSSKTSTQTYTNGKKQSRKYTYPKDGPSPNACGITNTSPRDSSKESMTPANGMKETPNMTISTYKTQRQQQNIAETSSLINEENQHKTNNGIRPNYEREQPEKRIKNSATEGQPTPEKASVAPEVTEEPRATETRSARDHFFLVATQNVQGLRGAEEKIEHITRLMIDKNIQAYLIQETHLQGDFTQKISGRLTFIHHGPETQPTKGAKGGVGIILSREWTKGWTRGGNITRHGGNSAGNTTRLLSIDVVLETAKVKKLKTTKRKSQKQKPKTITLVTSYHPHTKYKEEEAQAYNQSLVEMTNRIPKTNAIIVGADINASIGTRQKSDDESESTNILGPCGNPRKNERGEMILNLLRQTDLRAVTTYFNSTNGHDTWTHPATKEKHQLDHFLVSRLHCRNVIDARKKYIGAPSDHLALFMKYKYKERKKMSNKKKQFIETKVFKVDNNILRQAGKDFKSQIANFIKELHEEVDGKSSSETLKAFEKFVVKSAEKIAMTEVKRRPDWFTESELELSLRIFLQNRAQ